MDSTLKDFLADWKQIRGKTFEFLKTLPEEKIAWRPHELLGTFGMQLRHLGKSQEAYIQGIRKGKIDFTNKTFEPSIETDKKKAIAYLKKLDAELVKVLLATKPEQKIIFMDGVYGEMKITLTTVLSYLMNHEVYHQGIFTCYGRLAGLGKFRFM